MILDSLSRMWDSSVPRMLEDPLFRASLGVAEKVMSVLRSARFYPEKLEHIRKSDGTICTQFDILVERYVRKLFSRHFPEAHFCWEEFGGDFRSDSLVISVDPIDGTNSFVTHEKTNAFSLSIFQSGEVHLWLVANPATGEIFSAFGDECSLLIQLGMGSSKTRSRRLPTNFQPDAPILLETQLSHASETRALLDRQSAAWLIRGIKNSGGSPALQLAEASKGFYVYVCDWHGTPSLAHDLAAGVKIVRNAGGLVVDLEGKDVSAIWYSGTFVAWVTKNDVQKVVGFLQNQGN